jgi:hypothetical protein
MAPGALVPAVDLVPALIDMVPAEARPIPPEPPGLMLVGIIMVPVVPDMPAVCGP